MVKKVVGKKGKRAVVPKVTSVAGVVTENPFKPGTQIEPIAKAEVPVKPETPKVEATGPLVRHIVERKCYHGGNIFNVGDEMLLPKGETHPCVKPVSD